MARRATIDEAETCVIYIYIHMYIKRGRVEFVCVCFSPSYPRPRRWRARRPATKGGELKKRLSPGDFPRHPKTVGPDNKKAVTKHANYSIRGHPAFVSLARASSEKKEGTPPCDEGGRVEFVFVCVLSRQRR